jgi:predicted metalloendopeptidase
MSRRLGTARAAALSAAILLGLAPAVAADPQGVDASVRPGDDFYGYANGEWLRTQPLPEGRSSYDTSAMLRARNAERVQALIDAAAKAPATARARRIGDYYSAWMDEGAIEARGLAPIAGDLAAIAAIGDRRALSAWLGRSMRLDDGSNTATDGLLGVWIHQGFHDGHHYAAHLVQGGLGLADRDDYLDPGRGARRELYRAHVAAVLKLAGFDQADARADRVLALEIAIARTHASRADTDDVFKTDNAWRRADFAEKAPGLVWAAWFKAAGLDRKDLDRPDAFVVWQPSAVVGAAALAGSRPLEAWKDYLAFHLAQHYAAVLPRAFREEDAAFAGRLAGQPAATPDRRQEAIAAVTAAMGEDIGRLYVARYLPPSAKVAAEAMAANLRTAFKARIAGLTWMSPATRRTALAKLAALKVGVGYPDHWNDMSGLVVKRGEALGNLRRAEAFAYGQALARLGRPVDPGEWSGIFPQQVAALINFSPNSLQFSAGLMQPPYFDPGGDSAANFGSAGAGMAHEISHTFDELGALYDPEGRLGSWWSNDDHAQYRAAATPLVAQLAAYCPRPGLCLNGGQVLGESIGDLAGLLVAHDAYLLSLGGRPDGIRDGLTGDQRFFLAYARRWRRLQTEAALRRQVAGDTHPPGEYRADAVRNSQDWSRAFDVKPGDRLYVAPAERVRIW